MGVEKWYLDDLVPEKVFLGGEKGGCVKGVAHSLNTERSYKRQGHTPLKHLAGFLCNGGKPE